MNDETLEDRLARIGDEAEAGEEDQSDRPIPAHVKVGRPNRARSKVLQVRLNPEELVALEAIAARRELPVSTVAREQLLRLVAEDGVAVASGASLVALAEQLVGLSARLRTAVVHDDARPLTRK